MIKHTLKPAAACISVLLLACLAAAALSERTQQPRPRSFGFAVPKTKELHDPNQRQVEAPVIQLQIEGRLSQLADAAIRSRVASLTSKPETARRLALLRQKFTGLPEKDSRITGTRINVRQERIDGATTVVTLDVYPQIIVGKRPAYMSVPIEEEWEIPGPSAEGGLRLKRSRIKSDDAIPVMTW